MITEETKTGGSWKEGTKTTVYSGTPEASRSILLDDDDRVIIEGKVEAEVVVNPTQMSASRIYYGEKAEEMKKKDEEQNKKLEALLKEEKDRLEKEKPEEAKLREEQAKARDEKIMGKQEKPEDKNEPKAKGRADYNSPQDDSGLRHETPADSKTVKDETSTTKPKR